MPVPSACAARTLNDVYLWIHHDPPDGTRKSQRVPHEAGDRRHRGTRISSALLRQRGRLVSSMVRPLIWLFVIGTGFQGMLEGLGRGGYQRFLVPGLLSI